MASIQYSRSEDLFIMYRGALDENGQRVGEYYRDFMKEEPAILTLYDNNIQSFKYFRSKYNTTQRLCRIFNHSENYRECGSFVLSKDFDCWVCFDNNFRAVLYFGEDKPVRKIKSYKTICKKVKEWQYDKVDYTSNEHEVKFWKVKQDDKMIICELGFNGIEVFFPELYDRVKYRSQITNDVLWKLEPFRIKRNWDIPDDIKKEIQEKEEAKKKKEEAEKRRIEELKRTPGYCDECGNKACYTITGPSGILELCEYCYDDKIGFDY